MKYKNPSFLKSIFTGSSSSELKEKENDEEKNIHGIIFFYIKELGDTYQSS